MTIPTSKAAKPVRATKLGGGDGLKHRAYDDAAWDILDAVQTFLVGPYTLNGTTHATLKAALDAVWVALKRVKVTGSANLDSPVVTPIGDDATGLALGGSSGALVAAGARALSWSTTVVEVTKNLTVSAGSVSSGTARIFTPGITQAPSTDVFVRWNATAGEFIAASSRRALKKNERRIENGLDVIRRIKPTMFDTVDGSERDVPGFIAEDLAMVDAGVATVDADGNPSGVQLEAIVSYLVAAVQELDRR